MQYAAAPAGGAAPAAARAAAPQFTGDSIKSPLMGIFYRGSTPSSPPFIKEGETVKAGQVLCLIEAMRLTLACVVLMLVATTWLWRSYDGVAAQDEPGRPPAFGSYIYDAAFVSRLKTSARARVWLRLEADDKTVFEGYLPASASKEWKASRRFTLWLRRPENVTVTLDNKTFGPSVLKTGRNVIPVTFSGFN